MVHVIHLVIVTFESSLLLKSSSTGAEQTTTSRVEIMTNTVCFIIPAKLTGAIKLYADFYTSHIMYDNSLVAWFIS